MQHGILQCLDHIQMEGISLDIRFAILRNEFVAAAVPSLMFSHSVSAQLSIDVP